MRGASVGPYAVLVGLAIAAVLWLRPDEANLRRRGQTPSPRVVIEGLTVPATGSNFGFTAAEAIPAAGGGPVVTLGGWRRGLDLRDVAVALAPGWVLRSTVGRFVGKHLTLSDKVWLDAGGSRRLAAGSVELRGDQLHFPGQVVFTSARGRSTTVDVILSRSELLARLR